LPERTENKAFVFVTVGTDHHPFDRLVGWVDSWLTEEGAEQARCLVQTGRSARPELAESSDYLGYDEMRRSVDEADAVVTHGGPGSIALVTSAGKRPVVVPRRQDLGEHVDDHQVAFTRRIAAEGKIELAETEGAFRLALARALEGDEPALAHPSAASLDAVARFETLVTELLSAGRGEL
jgi:UDP-N-acetylglucosamine transferase subunit ALG13